MAASWPSAKKTFTQVVNGITKLIALLFNSGYDEIEALQTYLGAPGNAQSKLAALNRLFKYMGAPLPKITWIDNDTIEIAPCVMVMYSGNNYVVKENTSALQIKVSVNLDTGAEAANTHYDVFLIGDGSDSQYTAKFVLQGSTPSGATYYKKVFTVRNNASSNLVNFRHIKDLVMLDVPVQKLSGGTGGWTDLDISDVLPVIAKACILGISMNGDGTCFVRPKGCTWAENNEDGAYAFDAGSGTSNNSEQRICTTDDSQIIQYKITGNSNISVEGYYIDLQ